MQETDKPSRKKPFFPISNPLRSYLKTHGREITLPVSYNDLLHITYSLPLKDKEGKDKKDGDKKEKKSTEEKEKKTMNE